ncbi:hypothetical protein M0R45_037048 [Rubus argutus]|uniref:F-box domain-containing protein n=1 Tax=Rubus argutus TaxID=59490 RepID=A0AAW1W3A6_RUBAR
MAVSTQLPHLPDLVVHQILRFVPTKVAVRMMFVSKQWEGVWFLDPILDFDEGTGHYQHNHDQHEVHHIRQQHLEKGDLENYYSLSRKTLINAKSLTSLRLECVTIKHMDEYRSSTSPIKKEPMVPSADLISKCLLPSLKTMSLETVHFLDKGNKYQWQFHYAALFSLIWECPFIEYLSLTSCCFKNSGWRQYLCSSSLKFLEIDECNSLELCVSEVVNLESFRLVSSSVLEILALIKCANLKDLSIFAPRHQALELYGCHDAAIIFPDSFRQTVSVPCPMVKRLYVAMKNPPTEDRDINDLKDSLRWMTPLVTHDIVPRKHNDPSTIPRY